MKRIIKVLFFTAALAGPTLLAGCESETPEEAPPLRPVRYQEVALLSESETRIFSGTTRAALETDLSFKVSGTLAERPVNVGDAVAAGQLIAQLDRQDYDVRTQEARAGLASAQAEQRNAAASYERTRGLYENRNASLSDLDASRAQAESAAARVRAAQQQLAAALLQASYTRLTSPQDCNVADVYARVNENVAAGQPVVRLNCGDCVEIVVTLPETFIARVNTGSKVVARVDALPGMDLPASVTEVGVAAVGSTYPVTVKLEKDCPGLRSGLAAQVEFSLPRAADVARLILPSVSVGEDSNGRFVYVLDGDENSGWHARRRAVTVGGVSADGITIVDGLQVGELVVTAGVRRITDGQQVSLLSDSIL